MPLGGVDGATSWFSGAVCVLQKEERQLREVLVERQSGLGKNQEEMAVTHTSEKKPKNAHAFDMTDSTVVPIGEARPPKGAKYTVEQMHRIKRT